MIIDGKKFSARRDSLFLRQIDVAQRAGLSLKTINNIETGVAHRVRRSAVPKLAEAVKLDPVEFEKQFVLGSSDAEPENDTTDVDEMKTEDLDELLDKIIHIREARRLPPLPEHVEKAVLKRAAKAMPKQS